MLRGDIVKDDSGSYAVFTEQRFVCISNDGRPQRECKSNENVIEEYKKMFESRISAGATQKIPWWEKSHAKTVAWSYDMEGHAKQL